MAGIDNLKPFKEGYDERRGSKPKGAIHLSTMIQNMLNEPIDPENVNPKEKTKTQMQAIISVAMMKAYNGDNKWAEWLAKYGYGQKFEVDQNISGELRTGNNSEELANKFSEFLKKK